MWMEHQINLLINIDSSIMASSSLISLIFILCFHLSLAKNAGRDDHLQTHIVRLRAPEDDALILRDTQTRESWYTSFLSAEGSDQDSQLLHFYHHVFHGFAAKLTSKQLNRMKKMKGFVSAWPERIRSLQTTHSPGFLGLQQNQSFWKDSKYGEGIVIGVLDSGVNSHHPSFGDAGMPPPPSKWQGKCESNIKCNNKLIGARNFVNESDTPEDIDGHGTHTAATAAGNFVEGANVFGNANGTAAGVAPRAHLAVYKVCANISSCADSAFLAGVEAAIKDGVDILSISLGGEGSLPFHEDVNAIGPFSAMQKGIFVSIAASNDGPSPSTIPNEAPWFLTVGASTIDRKLRATAVLGNNQEFNGESLVQPNDFLSQQLPLVYPAGSNISDSNARFCNSSLNNFDIKGKIVLCFQSEKSFDAGQNVKGAGGAGMILMNSEKEAFSITVGFHVLPVAQVSFADGQGILKYINASDNATATIIFKGTIFEDAHAPAVASFSSRGPNLASPGILKPDIIGPGVNILAAWPYSVEGKNDTNSTFYIMSGTSMSCPHLSGVAALLKSSHPDWSPAMIKSSIMTTAYQTNLQNNPIEDETLRPADLYAVGAGHVNASRANDPGLLYDIRPDDYIPYLCGLNYTNEQVNKIVNSTVDCGNITAIAEADLNYPSFSIRLGTSSSSSTQNVTRTLTYVGAAGESYSVEIVQPGGVAVAVQPTSLLFSQHNQKANYTVAFSRSANATIGTSAGYLRWNPASGGNSVRSPIVVVLY